MGFNTTPVHGKYALIYWLRPNHFKGSGLNDVTWGMGYDGAASGGFEVKICTAAGTDQFQWRKNNGAWSAKTNITGAAQTLSDSQTITFAATTGHTLGDRWFIGNLAAEACTESGDRAQITDPDHRVLNPNATITWTDSGGEVAQKINYPIGKARFSGDVTAVTVAGNNGYMARSYLQLCGYAKGWSITTTLNMADASRLGQDWAEYLPGLSGATGTIEKMFIGNASLFEVFEDNVDNTQKYFLIEFHINDPDSDQTGDHFDIWVTFDSFGVTTSLTDVVKENLSFTVNGIFSTFASASSSSSSSSSTSSSSSSTSSSSSSSGIGW